VSNFIDDEIPAIEIKGGELRVILIEISKLWPEEVEFKEKIFGIDNYSCRSIVQASRIAREEFESVDWGDDIEIAGIALDFFGMAVKQSSKYLLKLKISNLDLDSIISNIKSRDDVLVV
jgi:hypothetical protein